MGAKKNHTQGPVVDEKPIFNKIVLLTPEGQTTFFKRLNFHKTSAYLICGCVQVTQGDVEKIILDRVQDGRYRDFNSFGVLVYYFQLEEAEGAADVQLVVVEHHAETDDELEQLGENHGRRRKIECTFHRPRIA